MPALKRRVQETIDVVTTGVTSVKKMRTSSAPSTMPTAYTSVQKAAIQRYVEIANVDKASAARTLKQHNWDVQGAANAFFASGANTSANPHKSKANKLFDGYRESPKELPDEVNMDGMQSMLEDMKVDMGSVDILIFSELVGSPSLGNITREGFVEGLAQEGISDPSKVGAAVASRRKQLSSTSDRTTLKKVYKHTFLVARKPGQKAVNLEEALAYWGLLFTSPSLEWSSDGTPWRDWWTEFLQEKWKRSVNKDMWDQTLVFALKTLEDEDMSFWSEDSAWPGVIDDFVAYVREKRGVTTGGEEMDVS